MEGEVMVVNGLRGMSCWWFVIVLCVIFWAGYCVGAASGRRTDVGYSTRRATGSSCSSSESLHGDELHHNFNGH